MGLDDTDGTAADTLMHLQTDEDFKESNQMHAINGYVYGNLNGDRGLTMREGEVVRWHVMGLGNQEDHCHVNHHIHAGMIALYAVEPCAAPPCSTAAPLSRPLLMSEELERQSRRDDALTAALVAYGVVAALLTFAYCLNKTFRAGSSKKKEKAADLP